MALEYPDVLDHYDRSKAFGDPRDFKTFANDMESLHPGQGFGEAAQRDGWWTRLSTRLDQNVFQPVAAETTEPLGREIGGFFGQAEAGARVGRGLPRALVETAPLYLAGPEAGLPATIAAASATGGLMGAHTYAETGSPKVAVISGVTGAALPGVGRLGGGILPRVLKLGESVPAADLTGNQIWRGGVLPAAGVGQATFKAARFTGSQAAMIGTNVASSVAQNRALGGDESIGGALQSPDLWLQQIPFTVFDAVHGFEGKVPTAQEVRGQIVQPKKPVSQYVPPDVSQPEAEATIEATMANLRVAYLNPNTPPEQKEAALAAANALIQNPKGVTAAAKVVKQPEAPQDVTGYAKQYSNGNWKVLQTDEQGNEKTVWVNGVEPTRNDDGTMTFKASSANVSPNVATPLTHGDFGIDRNQPDLPPQANPMGLFPWEMPEYKAALQQDQQRTLEANGIKPPEDMPDDVRQLLRQETDKIEQSQQAATEARAKATLVPQATEDVPSTFDIPTIEAISKARSLVGEDELRRRAEAKMHDSGLPEPLLGRGIILENTAREIIQEHVKSLLQTAVDSGLNAKQATEKTRLQVQTPVVDSTEQQTNASRETAKVISLTGEGQKPQAQYADYVRDDNGENFKTRGYAEAYRDAHPEYADHVVRDAGKGKGFYLGRQINKEVSLEGTNLEKVLGSTTDPAPLESRPDVSFEDGLEQLNRASQNPLVFAKGTDFDSVADAILALRQAKVVFPLLKEGKTFEEIQTALATAKVASFTGPNNAVAVMDEVRRGLGNFTDRTRDFTLGSTRPFDQKTVDEIGIQHPDAPTAVRNVLQWFVNHKDSGVMGDLVAAALKAHGTDGINLTFDPKDGVVYTEGTRNINMSHLPAEGEGFSFAIHMVHEYMHDVMVDVFSRTDPAAVAFRSTITESLNALKNSPQIPKEVRKAIAPMSGWIQEVVKPGADPFKLYQNWKDIVGEGKDDWLHVVYGMGTEKELVSTMFDSPKLMSLMLDTKMPTKQVSVLQYISAAWNKLFGGKKEADNVLAHILSGLDNYLSGSRVPSGQNVIPSPLLQVIGRKGVLLKNEQVNALVASFAQGRKVTDAFGGSGQLASFLKTSGAKEVGLNIRDPQMRAVFDEIKNDPNGFADRVQKIVEPIRLPSDNPVPQMVDGSSVKDYLDGIEKTDPNAALFVKQNFNARGREVTRGAFSPLKMFGTKTLQDLPNRVRSFAKQIDTLSSEDGWNIVGQAKAGDFVTVDPPYIGGTNQYAGVNKITVEEQLKNYENSLYPAAERGAKFVVFDVAHPQLIQSLQEHGFNVQEVNRVSRSGVKVQPELVATNQPLSISRTLASRYSGRDYLRDYLISNGVRPEALASRMSTIESVFSGGSLQPSIDGFTREMGAGLLPTTTEAGPLKPELTMALASGEPSNVRDLTKMLVMNDVPVHEDLYARMKEDVEAAVNLYTNIRKGLIPGELPSNAKESLLKAQVRLDAMSQGLRRQRIDIQRFNDLHSLTADGIQQTWIAGLSSDRLPSPPDPTEMQRQAHEALGLVDQRREISRGVLEQGKTSVAANWIRKNFMFMQYLKELIPAIKPIVNNLFKLAGTTNFWKNELDAVYEMDPKTKEFDKVRKDANLRVATNPTLNRAASNIKLWNQTEEAAGRKPSLTDSYVQNELIRFNKPDRDAIISEANNARAVHEHITEVTAPRYLAQKNNATVAKVIALREQGMQPDNARDLAGQFSSALDQMKDPQTAQVGLEMLNALRSKMQPETFLSAFQLMKGLQEDSTKHLEFMRSRPYYVTEQRMDGKHAIRMVTPDNKPYLNTFGTRDLALVKVKELEGRGYKYLEYIPAQDLNVPYRGINEEFIGKLRELDLHTQNRMAQALQGVDPTIVNTILPELGRASDYEASLAAFTPVPGAGFPKRHFAAGREELNMVQQQNMFVGRFVNWMRHQLTRSETELDMLHPDMLADSAATKMMRQKVTEFLTPDSPLARKMSEFTYNWKLAGNFGVNALHLVQSLNTGMASLISETGGVGDALEHTIKAQKAIADRVFNGKWTSKDHDWLTRRAGAEGVLGNVTWDGDIGDSKRNALQYATTPLWNKPIEGLKYAARSFNGMFFKFNDAVGLISAFDLGRSRGMGYEEAYNFARDVKNRGYFTGGKVQRSGIWGAFGPDAKAVPQLMSSLQTYVQGWFSLLAYNYTRGFGKAPQGMSAAQVLGAKKAFLYQLGAQAVLAGALGLPGVGQGMALVKQSTGVDVMSWLRQNLGEMFNEDQKAGGMMTTLALHGLPAAASEFGIPSVDLSGRHMPSVPYIGVTPYKGFDVANLAGAPISSVADLVKGLMAAAKGDVNGMSSLLPEVLKGPLRLWQGEGDVRDKGGNLITKLSPYERAITAMGLKPPRVTALQDVATAVKEANARASAEKSSIVDAIATTYRKNGVEQGHQALIQYLQVHPNEDGKALVREVSRRVVNQTTVPDWSQRANVAADLSGLGGEATSQAQRYSQTQDIQASLGLHQRPSRTQPVLMDQIDLLRQTDPYLSVAEAEQLARSQRPRRPSIGLVPQEYQ